VKALKLASFVLHLSDERIGSRPILVAKGKGKCKGKVVPVLIFNAAPRREDLLAQRFTD
jgi:hypothetical protein